MVKCDCCKDELNVKKVPRKPNYQKLVEISTPAYGIVLNNRLKEDAQKQRRQHCTAPVLRRDGGAEVLAMPCSKFTPDCPEDNVYQRKQKIKYCAMKKDEFEKAPCRDCKKKGQGMDFRGGKDFRRLQDRGSGDFGFRGERCYDGGYAQKKDERFRRIDDRPKKRGTEYIIVVDKDVSSSSASDSIPSIKSSSSSHTRSSTSSAEDKRRIKKGDKVTVCMPCEGKSKRDSFILKGDKLKIPGRDQAKQEDRSGWTRDGKTWNQGSRSVKTVDYAYRCESRELIGSKMITSCDCVKRNGLQDQCRRTACRGREACLKTPWPDCWPSGGTNGVDKSRITGVARYNPVIEYRQDKIKYVPARNKDEGRIRLAFQPESNQRRRA